MTLFLVIVAVLLLSGVLGCQYSKFDKQHTMCRSRENGCKFKLLRKGVSETQVTEILNVHNTLRNKVAEGKQSGQPTAANMFILSWDPELATIAQRWADQCSSTPHDTGKQRRSFKFEYVGQNRADTWSTVNDLAANFTQAINMWFDEVTKPGFSSSGLESFVFNAATGHYTQVVWAETKAVGCGYVAYKEGSWYKKVYICNYGPSGNFIGRSVYKRGPVASACSKKVSSLYKGLCVA